MSYNCVEFALGFVKKMELEEMMDVDGKRSGRQVHERDVLGNDEAKADAKKEDGRKGRIRRATFDDLKAIMDINDNIYEGFDYMPTLFYIFMQSKLHVIYVYEEDGKLVSLVNFRFHPDCDDLVTAMSLRVHPSYQGRGLAAPASSPGFAQLLKEHPAITRYLEDQLCSPKVFAKMHEMNLLYHWNALVYKLTDRQWMSRLTRIRQMAFGANRPFSPSYTSAIEWLERSDQLIRFISKYVVDHFPFGPEWVPLPINRSGLRHVLACAKVYISLDPSSTTDNSNSCDPISITGFLPIKGCGPQTTIDKGQESDIVGLSYSTALSCKHGIRIDIFFYGDCEEIFLSHVYSHLLHCISIISDEIRIGVFMHFPLIIDSKNVEQRLREAMGERFRGLGSTEVVQYTAEFPQAKQ